MIDKEFENDPLQTLFYDLVRDCSPGLIESIVRDMEEKQADTVVFSNNYLADYAKELADRLRKILNDHENLGPNSSELEYEI